jgi:putative two-component system response regulator
MGDRIAVSTHLRPGVTSNETKAELVDPSTLKQSRIQICDDQEASVVLLERILKAAGYLNVAGTTDSSRVVELCAQSPPDIILLDLHMPHPDGFEVMRQVKLFLEGPWLPIVVLTADTTPEAKQRALSAGARDFLNKPLDHAEVILRVQNLLEARFLHLEQRDYSAKLERTVNQRTSELEDARLEVLERLATASEYRDDDTGEHAQRVGRTSALILSALGRPPDDVELIRHGATLHDIGKIGVPDAILLKRGRLTPLEYEAMKVHVEVGSRILSGSRSPLLRLSEEIAVSHHEKWDGTGYPAGLSGDGIPLSGRAVALADAFDAMTHERPYRSPLPLEGALEEVRKQSGRHFAPEIAEVFMTLPHQALFIR